MRINEETYLVALLDASTQKYCYVIIENNKDMSKLFSSLSSTGYIISSIAPMYNLIDSKTFFKSLSQQKKPDDMNFGELN